MRICHAIFSNPWAARAGGGQLAVHELASAMTALGHEVHAIYSRLDGEAAGDAVSYEVHWSRYGEYRGLNLDFLKHGPMLERLLESRTFDVVFCHGENGACFPRICRRRGVALHGVLHASRLPATARWHLREIVDGHELNYRLLRHILERCDVVHAFSRFTERLAGTLARAGRPQPHRSMLGIDPAWCGCYLPRLRPPGDRQLTGISWGRLERGKGQTALIDSFASIRAMGIDARLILVGDGSLGPAIRAYGARKLGPAVVFTGALGPNEIRKHLLAADAAVFLSEMESFGLAVAEASAAGIPTFAGDVGGIADALAEGRGGTLVEPNAIAMAEQLSSFLAAPEPFLAVARAGTEIGATRTWRAAAETMLGSLYA